MSEKYTAEMADAYLQKRQAEEAAKERQRRERFEKSGWRAVSPCSGSRRGTRRERTHQGRPLEGVQVREQHLLQGHRSRWTL
jgi:hypothetical protein